MVTQMAANLPQMEAGGVHFAYDSTLPVYIGVLRRGGDGKDIRWFKGTNLFCTHVMGAWCDGDRITLDMDGGEGNQFPFFPSVHEPFDPVKARGRVRRFTIDLTRKSTDTYQVETLYPQVTGVLSRQDDRYHTVPYRWGYINAVGPNGGWAIFDHANKSYQMVRVPEYSLSEMTFVPRRRDAPGGGGYLVGIGSSMKEAGRSDLILIDTKAVDAGPVARVKMPFKVVGQVHGFWADTSQLPAV
jgi:carotenoid cleavage dioxygenase